MFLTANMERLPCVQQKYYHHIWFIDLTLFLNDSVVHLSAIVSIMVSVKNGKWTVTDATQFYFILCHIFVQTLHFRPTNKRKPCEIKYTTHLYHLSIIEILKKKSKQIKLFIFSTMHRHTTNYYIVAPTTKYLNENSRLRIVHIAEVYQVVVYFLLLSMPSPFLLSFFISLMPLFLTLSFRYALGRFQTNETKQST